MSDQQQFNDSHTNLGVVHKHIDEARKWAHDTINADIDYHAVMGEDADNDYDFGPIAAAHLIAHLPDEIVDATLVRAQLKTLADDTDRYIGYEDDPECAAHIGAVRLATHMLNKCLATPLTLADKSYLEQLSFIGQEVYVASDIRDGQLVSVRDDKAAILVSDHPWPTVIVRPLNQIITDDDSITHHEIDEDTDNTDTVAISFEFNPNSHYRDDRGKEWGRHGTLWFVHDDEGDTVGAGYPVPPARFAPYTRVN